jgi:cytochrome P450
MNERSALRDTTLPLGGGPDGLSPIFVPVGGQVLISLYAMQRRKDIWGGEAEEWKPERWEDRKFGWEFIPFGGGVRQCLGES